LKKQRPKIINGKLSSIWRKEKLNNIAPLRGGFAFKSEKFQKSGIPIVRISNIKFDGTVGGEFEYYSKINPDEKFVLKGCSILLAMSGATTGKIAMLDSEEEYYQNQRVGYFQNTGAVDYDFLSSILQTKDFINQLNSVLVAGAQPNISSKEIDSFVFYIPESLDEQSAIGSLFRTLGDLLASYKDNLANYQSLKAAMLSKMFPKAGQKVPEIRLEGFEGEWEKYYLGDVFEQVSNYIEPSVENELWSLTVENGLTPKTDRYKRDFLVKKNDKFKKVDLNEFVYNPMNLTLGALDLNNNEVTISVSGYYVVIKNRDIEKFDNNFLKILLKTTYAIYQYKQFATGTLIEKQRVQFPTFSEIPFYLPPIAEQQAIGSYFSNLENLIVAHQDKISQLETLKKKLLQDMFV
jgi:restriction modification system DNA specificity domain protein